MNPSNSRKVDCTPSQFRCETGDKVCIPMKWTCDYDWDCQDGSDEKGCGRLNCLSQNIYNCQIF